MKSCLAALVPPLSDATSRVTNEREKQFWRVESCVAKTDICLPWGNMLTNEQTFVLKTYYATRLNHRLKEAFHTEFLNSVTLYSDSSILRLIRKFEEVGSVQDKPWKGRPHTATTVESVEEVCELVAQNPHTLTRCSC